MDKNMRSHTMGGFEGPISLEFYGRLQKKSLWSTGQEDDHWFTRSPCFSKARYLLNQVAWQYGFGWGPVEKDQPLGSWAGSTNIPHIAVKLIWSKLRIGSLLTATQCPIMCRSINLPALRCSARSYSVNVVLKNLFGVTTAVARQTYLTEKHSPRG